MLGLLDDSHIRLPRRSASLEASLDENGNEVVKTVLTSSKKSTSSFRRFFMRRVTRSERTIYRGSGSSSSASIDSAQLAETISSDALLQDREAISISPTDLRSLGSISSNSSTDKKNGEETVVIKKKKYFSERKKNIFKKLLHPSYQERNIQYKRLFGHLVDENDLFLISFSCAYQREILCQGRMYITQRHVCFHANILGWETRIAVPFQSITTITKERAALIFPNSIQMETEQGDRYFFASFVHREKTAAALNKVLEGVQTGKLVSPEEMWEFMNTDRTAESFKRLEKTMTAPNTPLAVENSPPITPSDSPLSIRARSQFPVMDNEVMTSSSIQDEQGDVTCPCDTHSGKLLLDAVYPLSPDEIRQLLFTDSPWFKRFNEILKNTAHRKVTENVSDYHSSSWAMDKDGVQNRTCTYSMALNHAMAPKSCVVTEKQIISHLDRPADGFVVHKETQNSGIPYADHFSIQCRYCVTRVGERESRVVIHGGINYKKSIWSMVKGYIEKSTYQGLDDHYAALEATLSKECEKREHERERDYENDSLASSVEDPTTERMVIMENTYDTTIQREQRTHVRDLPRTISCTTPLPTSIVVDPHAANYKFYIQVIIVLLGGLLFLNLLLLFRVNSMEQQPSIRQELTEIVKRLSSQSSVPPPENKVLENLMDALTQSAAELQKLKQQRAEL